MAKEAGPLLGLDIGSHSAKLVRLRGKAGGHSLLNLALAELPPGAVRKGEISDASALVEALRGLLAGEGLRTAEVAIALSGKGVVVRNLRLPRVPPAELEDLLSWEAEQYLPFSLREAHLDYQIQGEGKKGEEWLDVLLAAARRPLIEGYLEVLARVGLETVIVDAAPLALARGFLASGGSPMDGAIALVDIGAEETLLNVMSRGRTLLALELPVGGEDYTRALQEALGVDRDGAERAKRGQEKALPTESLQAHFLPVTERLAQQIRRAFSVLEEMQPDTEVAGLVLSGGGSQVKGIATQLMSSLKTAVDMANPFARVSFKEESFDRDFVSSMAPFCAVGFGLAIRRLGD